MEDLMGTDGNHDRRPHAPANLTRLSSHVSVRMVHRRSCAGGRERDTRLHHRILHLILAVAL